MLLLTINKCGFFSNTCKLRSPYLCFISFRQTEWHETHLQENLNGAVSLKQQKPKLILPTTLWRVLNTQFTNQIELWNHRPKQDVIIVEVPAASLSAVRSRRQKVRRKNGGRSALDCTHSATFGQTSFR
jgi:hypothetical protein